MIYNLLGLGLIFLVLLEGFEAIILPRRVTRRFRFTRFFYIYSWLPARLLARRLAKQKRRERLLSFYGPLSLLVLLITWAFLLILGFALLLYQDRSAVASSGEKMRFFTYFYLSGVTFFTLGFGDVTLTSQWGRLLSIMESGLGFGFLAAIIGYMPVIYQSFSRREIDVTLLDARAGSPSTPATLLMRYGQNRMMPELENVFRDWERWAAEVLESHLSYPVLCFYRSQHDNQSWLGALTTVLDTCALVMVGVDGLNSFQAQLTFAMSRHVLVDLTGIFNQKPIVREENRLPDEDLTRLQQLLAEVNVSVCLTPASPQKLRELRLTYEPYLNALSEYLVMDLPPWIPAESKPDNWQTSAFSRDIKPIIGQFGTVPEDDHF